MTAVRRRALPRHHPLALVTEALVIVGRSFLLGPHRRLVEVEVSRLLGPRCLVFPGRLGQAVSPLALVAQLAALLGRRLEVHAMENLPEREKRSAVRRFELSSAPAATISWAGENGDARVRGPPGATPSSPRSPS